VPTAPGLVSTRLVPRPKTPSPKCPSPPSPFFKFLPRLGHFAYSEDPNLASAVAGGLTTLEEVAERYCFPTNMKFLTDTILIILSYRRESLDYIKPTTRRHENVSKMDNALSETGEGANGGREVRDDHFEEWWRVVMEDLFDEARVF
jgi:hypothetical protein